MRTIVAKLTYVPLGNGSDGVVLNRDQILLLHRFGNVRDALSMQTDKDKKLCQELCGLGLLRMKTFSNGAGGSFSQPILTSDGLTAKLATAEIAREG